MAFSISLLLLIGTIAASQSILENNEILSTYLPVLWSMLLVAVTTPLSVMVEREHKVPPLSKKIIISLAVLFFIATCIAAYFNKPQIA